MSFNISTNIKYSSKLYPEIIETDFVWTLNICSWGSSTLKMHQDGVKTRVCGNEAVTIWLWLKKAHINAHLQTSYLFQSSRKSRWAPGSAICARHAFERTRNLRHQIKLFLQPHLFIPTHSSSEYMRISLQSHGRWHMGKQSKDDGRTVVGWKDGWMNGWRGRLSSS